MAELFSRYESGLQFQAGTMTGSALGVSGLNPIVDRLNSISTDDGNVIGSFVGNVISGAGNSLYISGGQIDKTPSVGDDIANKTYVDSKGIYNKKNMSYTGAFISGTIIGSFAYTDNHAFHLNIFNYNEQDGVLSYRIAKMYNGTKENDFDITFHSYSGNYQHSVLNIIANSYEANLASANFYEFNNGTAVTEFKGGGWGTTHLPTHIAIVCTGSKTNNFGIQAEYYQI